MFRNLLYCLVGADKEIKKILQELIDVRKILHNVQIKRMKDLDDWYKRITDLVVQKRTLESENKNLKQQVTELKDILSKQQERKFSEVSDYMRIGTKRFSIGFYLRDKPTKWHDGKYTLTITKESYIDSMKEYSSNWWTFVPSGRPYMGWVAFIRREWRNFRLLFR